MENIKTNIEKILLSTGKITKTQIDEIREMFILTDTDKSGKISYDEIARLMTKLAKTIVKQEDIQKIIQKLDLNKDGIIEWDEFLQAMFTWLSSQGLLINTNINNYNELSSDNTNITHSERKMLHFNLANFFLQFTEEKNIVDLQHYFAEYNENLEDRTDSWDFFGSKTYYSIEEKWQYYHENQRLLENFSLIAQQINSIGPDNLNIILDGLRSLVHLLTIVDIFKTPQERFLISQHIIRLFDLVINSSVINKVIVYLNSDEAHIVWESLKIISLFAPGPRIANTPETSSLHPNQMYHKVFLVNNGIIQTMLKLIQTQWKEVKHQATLCLGFLIRNSNEIRDLVISLDGVNILISLVDDNCSLELARAISWTISLISGVTLKEKFYLSDMNIILTLVKTFTWFLFWKDDPEIITNSLLGLTYLLPLVEINIGNKNVWERVLCMITHNTILVKRAALNCLRNIISCNEIQCQFIVENKLIQLVAELLNYNNLNCKIEACNIITLLALKGYIWYILEINNVLANLTRLMYEDSNVRWNALKSFKALSSSATDFNRILLQNNLIKAIFSNLTGFKDYDKVLHDIYGYLDPSYNFKYLNDSIATLNNLITVTNGVLNPQEYLHILVQYLEQANFDKLQHFLDMMFIEIENRKIDLLILEKDSIEFSKLLNEFLENCVAVFNGIMPSEYTKRMIDYLTAMKNSFQQNSEKLQAYVQTFSTNNILTQMMEIRCYSSENFPNGDNRILELPVGVSLMELLLNVENCYKKSPISLHYIDEYNEQITIDSDQILKRALERAFQETHNTNENKIILKLIIACPMSKLLRSYLGSDLQSMLFDNGIIDIFNASHTNLSNRTTLIDELNRATTLNQFEIEKIYNAFINVTRRRLANINDGTVNYVEFAAIMKQFTDDTELVQQIFNSMDMKNTGLIDFRDFICLISILKSGSLEDKLRLAFMAYDIDHNGFIDKEELFKLLRTSSKAKGLLTNDNDLRNAVQIVFSAVDQNKDGYLSYTEFKEAVLKHQVFINPFWTDSKYLRIFIMNPQQNLMNIGFGFNGNINSIRGF